MRRAQTIRCRPPRRQSKRCCPPCSQSREEEKRRRRTKREQKTYELLPHPALLLTQMLVTSRLAQPIVAFCGKEATRKRRMSRRGEWKEYKNKRRCTCEVRLPPVPTCVAVAVVPPLLRFSPVPPRPALIYLPSPMYSTGSCRRKERAERCQ